MRLTLHQWAQSFPTMNSIISKILNFARTVAVLAFWVLVWHLIAVKVDLAVVVPSPAEVIGRLIELAGESEFYLIVYKTVTRILSGFFIAVGAGTVLGIMTAKIKLLDDLLSPLLSVVKATPVASFIILTLFWLNKEDIPSFISFLMVLPIIHGNVSEGLKNTPKELIEMTRVFNISPWRRLTRVYLPSVIPYFTAGFKTSLGLAWKAGVAAEVLAFPKFSIGTEVYNAKNMLEMSDVFAWTLTVILISIVLEKLLMLIFKLLTRKRRGARAV